MLDWLDQYRSTQEHMRFVETLTNIPCWLALMGYGDNWIEAEILTVEIMWLGRS